VDEAGFEAVLAYDAAFVPRYARRFGELMLPALDLPSRASVLDLACRTGYSAMALLDLVRDGRVIAMDSDARYLELARAHAGSDVNKRVFFKQSGATELRFGDEAFTNVVGNLVDRVAVDRGAVLSEAWRVLRPGGQVAFTTALRGSFLEVLDLLREVSLRFDLGRVTERVEQYAMAFPSPESLRQELDAHSFRSVAVETRPFTLEYASGRDLLSDPVIHSAALAEWTWCAEGAPEPQVVIDHLRDTIDVYFQGRVFELTVVAGCVTARRPMATSIPSPP
jgi:ubiquinone/menaquinone biosynthesis C-methylase UbiE